MIDGAITSFTPGSALVGGVMIGLASVGLMAGIGRIAGISGIVARLLPPIEDDGWKGRLAFIAGLALAAPLAILLGLPRFPAAVTAPPLWLALAGLLVGFGAVLGGGCTSGHGVCGLARLSRRSIVAVATFMAAAFAIVFVLRHIW